MNYHLIRKTQGRSRFLGFWFPILCIGTIGIFHFFFPALLGGVASRVALPFWRAGAFAEEGFHKVRSFFLSKQALSAEVLRLSFKLQESERLLLDRDLLLNENAQLREQFGRGGEKPGRIIGAVLALPPRSPYDTAILDIGTQAGVKVGDRALFGSTVLGLVSKVYTQTSIVEFFSAPGRKTPVLVLHGEQAIPAEALGQGGGTFTATLPKEVSLRVGDAVVMPGLNPLLFAKVASLESNVTDSFEVVRFTNPIPFSTLRFLEVERSVQKE